MSDLPPFILEDRPWEKTTSSIWMTSHFNLRRNLLQSLFFSKLIDREASQVLDLLKNAIFSSKALKEPLFLKAPETSPLDKEYLFEHFHCEKGFQGTLDGEGFIIDQSKEILILLNIEDHIQLHTVDYQGDWQTAWNKLSLLESSFNLEYAFTPKFGYLTSDPANSGTGLNASTFIHVPALIHLKKLQEALDEIEEEVIAAGLEGSIDTLTGDILVLSNKYSLGISEEALLHALHSSTLKLVSAEKLLRSHLKDDAHMKDLVSRAYGLLAHPYQLQTKETLDALSMIKFALDLGWVAGVTDSKINEIILRCRRAHLAHLLKEKTHEFQDLPHKRAEYIHQELQGMELKI